jgi:hypothetical protein
MGGRTRRKANPSFRGWGGVHYSGSVLYVRVADGGTGAGHGEMGLARRGTGQRSETEVARDRWKRGEKREGKHRQE